MASLFGTASSDTLLGGEEADTVYGGGAETAPLDLADTILGGAGNDLLYGNGGNDFVLGQGDRDTIYGGVGDDSLYGGSSQTDTSDGSDALYAGVGSDWLFGNSGNDSLHGGDGTDTLYGGLGNDLIYGGNSYASNSDGSDWIAAGAGNDTIYGGAGNDSIFGGKGISDASDAADTIDGGSGSDVIYGNGGNDALSGGLGNDTIFGGAGADTITGGEGVDLLVGDLGDTIFGGVGIDRFILDASLTRSAATIGTNGFFATSLLTIGDLERGEVLQIRNLQNREIEFLEDSQGDAIISIGGRIFATLDNIDVTDIIDHSTVSNGLLIYTVGGGVESDSGGGAAPDVAPINSVPAAQTTNEDTNKTFNTAGGNLISVSDADSASLTAYTIAVAQGTLTLAQTTGLTFTTGDGTGDATMTFSGTIANINAALDGLIYAPTANYNGADTLTITANDGTTTDVDTVGITVTSVNDVPINSVPAAQTTNEDTNKTFNTAGGNLISVSDLDNVPLAAYTIAVAQGTLTLAQTTGLTFTTGDGTSDATMTFSGTIANINAALDGLIYAPTANYNGADTLTITASDGTATDLDSVGITVTSVADAPVNSVPAAQTTNEDTNKTFNTAGGNLISVSDADSASLTAYTIAVAQGTLTLAQTTGLTFTTGDGTGDATMTFSGTVTNINAALAGLIYTPTANYNGADTLTITANDGTTTDVDTVGITVTSVNDAPINSVPAAQTTNEDTNKTFSSGGGNLISVSDVESTSLTAYTIAVTQGTLTLAQTTGLTFTTGDGTSDATMTFSGTIANINAALDGLIYAPTANYNGAATMTITANDGTTTDVDTVGITVTSVADAPVNSVPAAQTTNEDTNKTFSSGVGNLISVSDVDSTSLTAYTIAVSHGTLTLSGTAGLTFTTGDGTADATMTFSGTVANINARLAGMIYTPTANYNGADTITITANDGTATDVDTVGITVTAVNDAPTLTGLDAVTFLENTVNASAQVIDSAVTLADVDSANFNGGNLTVTYSVGGAAQDSLSVRNEGVGAGQIGFDGTTITYAGTSIGTIGTNGAAGANLVINLDSDATPTAVDALIQNLTYANSSNSPTATRTISITVNDGAATSAAATSVITVTAQTEIDVVTPSDLDGLSGFQIDGLSSGDFLGCSVASAGDVNGDGFEDLIVGAYGADSGFFFFTGSSYVVFGKESGWAANFDLTTLDGTNGFSMDDTGSGNQTGFSVAAAGDVNDDGFGDIIVGANRAAPSGNTQAGSSYVVFGAAAGWASTFDLTTLNGANGTRLNGVNFFDESATSVSSAGDVNGDGYDDMIIGAKYADPNANASAGSSYVVFGGQPFGATFDLSTLDGTKGFRLDGVAADDLSGRSVASAGDVNGDGFDDMIVGSRADSNGNYAGSSYVVFGAAAGWAPTVALATLDGTTGFRLDGVAAYNYASISASAGDVNGDGYEDIIVGAKSASPNGSYSGSSYVVFGKASGWASTINLSTLNGTTGFRLDGVAAGDNSGFSVASAGDVNGDGFVDLIVGAKGADPNGSYSGSSYVVFGKASGWASTINLSTLNGTTGFRLDGVAANDYTGSAVASAGDLNGDGFDDMIVGAPNTDPNAASDAGSSYVIFGNNAIGTVTAVGTTGGDTLTGTGGADVMVGGQGSDTISSGNGNDIIKGGTGDDELYGNAGDDRLYGGIGGDTLVGGAGADTMIGGDDQNFGGSEVFVFAAGDSTSTNLDLVMFHFNRDFFDLVGAAADTVNTVNAVTANSLADVIAAYDNTGINQIGDANYIHVTAGTLAGKDYIILSTDGNATYDEGTDIFFQVIGSGTFTVADIF